MWPAGRRSARPSAAGVVTLFSRRSAATSLHLFLHVFFALLVPQSGRQAGRREGESVQEKGLLLQPSNAAVTLSSCDCAGKRRGMISERVSCYALE